jgi:ABC-type cobalamin transport system permease subunit
VDRLAKKLFPNNPRMVRYRKMRLLMVGVFLSIFSAVVVALLFYFANRFRP